MGGWCAREKEKTFWDEYSITFFVLLLARACVLLPSSSSSVGEKRPTTRQGGIPIQTAHSNLRSGVLCDALFGNLDTHEAKVRESDRQEEEGKKTTRKSNKKD